MKIIYELDDATDSASEIMMMAHARDYASALGDIDEKIRVKLKHCDVYAYDESDTDVHGGKLINTIDNLMSKNSQLILLLEDIRSMIGNISPDYI